jgi:acyl-CoA synthetase (NDP forming)
VGGYWTDFVVEGNRKLGFKGPVWRINPTRTKNKKNKYFRNIDELPGVPDCVYIAVSRNSTVKVIKDFASLGTGGAVCLASRFSETVMDLLIILIEYQSGLIKLQTIKIKMALS